MMQSFSILSITGNVLELSGGTQYRATNPKAQTELAFWLVGDSIKVDSSAPNLLANHRRRSGIMAEIVAGPPPPATS